MKTLDDFFHDYLIQHGLWPAEATAVMERAKAGPALESMARRWHDTTDGYPKVLLGVVWMSLREEAIKYLTETKPMHFALFILRGGESAEVRVPEGEEV